MSFENCFERKHQKSALKNSNQQSIYYSTLQRFLTRVLSANNINQIARIANSSRYISNNDLNYVQNKVIDFILKFEKKVYSRE